MPETKAGTVGATPFKLPLKYVKGEDNFSESDAVAGAILEGSNDEWYVARIWSDGVSNPDELAELMVKATNSYDATQTNLVELKSALLDCVKRMEKLRELEKIRGAGQAVIDILDTSEARALLSQEEK